MNLAWLRLLLLPQTLVGFLIFGLGVGMLLSLPGEPRVRRAEEVVVTPPDDAPEPLPVAVELTLVSAEGLEQPYRLELPLPPGESERLRVILAALRTRLVEEGVWPQTLPLPTPFLTETSAGERVAVLDFAAPTGEALTVLEETRLLASLRATLRENGVEEMRLLLDGAPSPTFLGHVALPGALE